MSSRNIQETYFHGGDGRKTKEKNVIICVSIRKYISPNLWKCPSLGPEERPEIKAVLKSPRWGLYATLLNMKPMSPIIPTVYIYIPRQIS